MSRIAAVHPTSPMCPVWSPDDQGDRLIGRGERNCMTKKCRRKRVVAVNRTKPGTGHRTESCSFTQLAPISQWGLRRCPGGVSLPLDRHQFDGACLPYRLGHWLAYMFRTNRARLSCMLKFPALKTRHVGRCRPSLECGRKRTLLQHPDNTLMAVEVHGQVRVGV